ncbi:MAG: HPF/RaiA family ribosome-associated protein [Opitutaceae bacterium]
MNNSSSNHEVILKGIHLDLTESSNRSPTRRYPDCSHEDRIIRIRVELEHDKTKAKERKFVAKGHIEIHGPSMNASVSSGDCLKSLDELIDKLDRMIRRRSRLRLSKRRHPHRVEIPANLPKV